MADESYHRLFAECRKRENFGVVFRSALDDVAGKVDFSWVRLCVAFGTGSGEYEMELARRLLPNLRAFHAVEPDHESVKALRVNFENGQLPGVETSVEETSLERWGGVDTPVDAVLLFNVLAHVQAADRKALFQQLITKYLNLGGIVVIIGSLRCVRSGFLLLMERLDVPWDDYDLMEKQMGEAGFRVVLKHDLRLVCDLSDPSDDVVKFVQLITAGRASECEVRAAIDDIYSQPNVTIWPKKFAIFAK